MPKSTYKSFDSLTVDLLLDETTPVEKCLFWGNPKKERYGTIKIAGKSYGVHRVMAKLLYGEPLPGQVTMHSCNNRPCINPKHLSFGTVKENSDYSVLCGRNFIPAKSGIEHKLSKLNDEIVRQIRTRSSQGEFSNVIAKDYGVSGRTVRYVIERKTWNHVK